MLQKYLIVLFFVPVFISGCSVSQEISIVPCNKLPSIEHVQAVVKENQEVIFRIENLSQTRSIWIDIDSERCPNKGEIVIYYGTEQQRKEIIDIIGNTFLGVPYTTHNI